MRALTEGAAVVVLLSTAEDRARHRSERRILGVSAAAWLVCEALAVWVALLQDVPALSFVFAWLVAWSVVLLAVACFVYFKLRTYRPRRLVMAGDTLTLLPGSVDSFPFADEYERAGALVREPFELKRSEIQRVEARRSEDEWRLAFGPDGPMIPLPHGLHASETTWLVALVQKWRGLGPDDQ